jgi:hypothetical protein
MIQEDCASHNPSHLRLRRKPSISCGALRRMEANV